MMAAGDGFEDAAEAAKQLESEVVVGVAASKYFSLALTAKGEVWTFGEWRCCCMYRQRYVTDASRESLRAVS
jgi:alpha-tubulin suppressor-like RCC1 family protein